MLFLVLLKSLEPRLRKMIVQGKSSAERDHGPRIIWLVEAGPTMTIESSTDELSPEAARVYRAAKAINAMSDQLDAELFPQPNPVLNALRLLAREAPLRSLAVAFVLGAMLARRR